MHVLVDGHGRHHAVSSGHHRLLDVQAKQISHSIDARNAGTQLTVNCHRIGWRGLQLALEMVDHGFGTLQARENAVYGQDLLIGIAGSYASTSRYRTSLSEVG